MVTTRLIGEILKAEEKVVGKIEGVCERVAVWLAPVVFGTTLVMTPFYSKDIQGYLGQQFRNAEAREIVSRSGENNEGLFPWNFSEHEKDYFLKVQKVYGKEIDLYGNVSTEDLDFLREAYSKKVKGGSD